MCMENRLSEDQLAIYGDTFVLDKLGQLPGEILEHVAEYLECEAEIAEVLEIIKKGGRSTLFFVFISVTTGFENSPYNTWKTTHDTGYGTGLEMMPNSVFSYAFP